MEGSAKTLDRHSTPGGYRHNRVVRHSSRRLQWPLRWRIYVRIEVSFDDVDGSEGGCSDDDGSDDGGDGVWGGGCAWSVDSGGGG
jgi:hypothetical protein